MHMLDNVHAESDSEVPEEVQVESSTNLALDNCKPRCITTNNHCLYILIIILCSSLIVH
jgi:hypothetical protein